MAEYIEIYALTIDRLDADKPKNRLMFKKCYIEKNRYENYPYSLRLYSNYNTISKHPLFKKTSEGYDRIDDFYILFMKKVGRFNHKSFTSMLAKGYYDLTSRFGYDVARKSVKIIDIIEDFFD